MTEIKKTTVDDVDLSGFKTRLSPPAGSVRASVFRGSGFICIGPFEGCPVLLRAAYGWRAASQADSCSASWLPHAVAVSEEFEAWLVTELARIDREREEAARPKIPTVKAPDGCCWRIDEDGDVCLVDKYGENWCVIERTERDHEHQFECDVASLKARAEALGKRIVVLDDAEKTSVCGHAVFIGKEL